MPETRSIGEILRDAEAGRLENVFREDREPYDLVGAADRLFDLLEERGVDYVLVGGMAMLQYVEGRNTRDIDLIVGPEFAAAVPEVALSSEDRDFGRGDFSGVQLDFLKTSNAVFDLVRKRFTTTMTFGNREITCATPEGLFLLKAYALPSLYRQGDFTRSDLYEGDLRALLRSGTLDEHKLLRELVPHMLTTDIKAVSDVVADARGHIAASTDLRERLNDQSEIRNPKSEI